MEYYQKDCEEFVQKYKKVYDDTRLGLKYKENIDRLEQRANKINLIREKYKLDEKNYKNRGVNLDMHEVIHNKDDELYHIKADIEYFKMKISKLSYDEYIYENYIRCENDIYNRKLNT
jgi:hypothetical protein